MTSPTPKSIHKPVRLHGKFRKVFCSCNDSWYRVIKLRNKATYPIVTCGIIETVCPTCRYNPWVYIDKGDEPNDPS
jgi:hypothetical protein